MPNKLKNVTGKHKKKKAKHGAVVVEGKHPFFKNRNRVGAKGLSCPIVFCISQAGQIKPSIKIAALPVSAEEIEVLYYVSLKYVYASRLEELTEAVQSLLKRDFVAEKKGRLIHADMGNTMFWALKGLKAVPED